jgi:hypothetical protein
MKIDRDHEFFMVFQCISCTCILEIEGNLHFLDGLVAAYPLVQHLDGEEVLWLPST